MRGGGRPAGGGPGRGGGRGGPGGGEGGGAEELPEVFPIRLWASALVVGCLGFFLCLAVKTDREAGYETAQSARTNLWASVLVFLAALLRLDELLQSASVGPHSSVQARLE